MTFAAAGFVPDQVDNVSVSAGGTTTINAGLTEDGAISGTVTDAKTGNPIAGATVECTCQRATTVTDSSGRYGFTDVVPAAYDVSVSASGYAPASSSGVIVNAGAATTQNFA